VQLAIDLLKIDYEADEEQSELVRVLIHGKAPGSFEMGEGD
jgi:hypothetical protein